MKKILKILKWNNLFYMFMFFIFEAIALKISASYEGCLLIQKAPILRVLVILSLCLLSILFLIPIRKDIYRFFINDGNKEN